MKASPDLVICFIDDDHEPVLLPLAKLSSNPFRYKRYPTQRGATTTAAVVEEDDNQDQEKRKEKVVLSMLQW